MRVLVVEDDPGFALSVKKGLAEASCRVDVAPNGTMAFASHVVNCYDVLILDVTLPDRNRFDVLRELRERDVCTPVVCLTAKKTVDLRVTARKSRVTHYLAKPFSLAEPFARIHAVQPQRGGDDPQARVRHGLSAYGKRDSRARQSASP